MPPLGGAVHVARRQQRGATEQTAILTRRPVGASVKGIVGKAQSLQSTSLSLGACFSSIVPAFPPHARLPACSAR
jgi:hypothetical protein